VLIITAGVDTQDNRLAVQLVGWGPSPQGSLAFWVLDYVELYGDPANEDVWTALTDLINRPIPHASGAVLRVQATAGDIAGHRREAAKNYYRQRRINRPMAIFGATAANAPALSKPKPDDVTWQGKTDTSGVMVYQVGTVHLKHWLFGNLSDDAERPTDQRRTHFSADLPPEYFTGLVSEIFDPIRNRFEKKRGARNEPLDTIVYATAAAHHPELRLHRFNAADWAVAAEAIARQAAANPQARPAQPATTPAQPAAAPPTTPAAVTEPSSATAAVPIPPPTPTPAPPPTQPPTPAILTRPAQTGRRILNRGIR
jgi:phage terminase large subunit GpA-like protein